MRDEGKLDLPDTIHKLVETNLFNGRETFYLCSGNNDVSKFVDFDEFIVTDVLETVIAKTGMYKHEWDIGDLLVWDNVSTMHRSAGDFEGPRLLFRVQVR